MRHLTRKEIENIELMAQRDQQNDEQAKEVLRSYRQTWLHVNKYKN